MSTSWHAYLWTSAVIVVLCTALTRNPAGAIMGALISGVMAIPWFIFTLVNLGYDSCPGGC